MSSASFIAALNAPEREEVLEAVRVLACGGHVSLRYLAEVQVCQRLG